MYVCKFLWEWKCHGPHVVIIAHLEEAASLFVPCMSCDSNSACQAERVSSFHCWVILSSHVHAHTQKNEPKQSTLITLWARIKTDYTCGAVSNDLTAYNSQWTSFLYSLLLHLYLSLIACTTQTPKTISWINCQELSIHHKGIWIKALLAFFVIADNWWDCWVNDGLHDK